MALTEHIVIKSLADDGIYTLPAGKSGWGTVIFGDNEGYALFLFSSINIVNLVSYTANVRNADTDGFFCICDGGTSVVVKNRIGSEKSLWMIFKTGDNANFLEDEGMMLLWDAKASWGHVLIGDGEEFGKFFINSSGDIYLSSHTINVVPFDSDTKWCIIDQGTRGAFRNRMGSAKIYNYEQLNGIQISFDDDESIALKPGESGWGIAMALSDAGETDAFIEFRFDTKGNISWINRYHADSSDADGLLCVFTSGESVTIKNRLGKTRLINFAFYYASDYKKSKLAVYKIGVIDQIQVLEDKLEDMIFRRGLIADAQGRKGEGIQLETIGKHIDLKRLAGESDENYIEGIEGKILSNKSDGTADVLLAILNVVYPDATSISLIESFPAAIIMKVIDDPAASNSRLYFIYQASSCGIGLHLHIVDETNPFRYAPCGLISSFAFCTLGTLITSTGHGLSDGDQIEISGSGIYDGFHYVWNITDDTYEIAFPYAGSYALGIWTLTIRVDGIGGFGDTTGTYLNGGLWSSALIF